MESWESPSELCEGLWQPPWETPRKQNGGISVTQKGIGVVDVPNLESREGLDKRRPLRDGLESREGLDKGRPLRAPGRAQTALQSIATTEPPPNVYPRFEEQKLAQTSDGRKA